MPLHRGLVLLAALSGLIAAAALVSPGVLSPAEPSPSPEEGPTTAPTPTPRLRTDALPDLAGRPPLAAAFELRVMRPDGPDGGVTFRSAERPHAQWAPHGDTLAWADGTGLHLLRPGEEPRRVADQPQQFWWSPAATHLATYDGETLRALDLAGNAVMTATVEGDLRSLVWSPTGSTLAWTVQRTLTPYQDFRTAGANEWSLSIRPVTVGGRTANQWTYGTPGTATPGEVLAWSRDETLVLLRTGERLQRLTLASSLLTEVGEGELAVVSPQGDGVAFSQRLRFPPCTDGVSVRQALTVLTWTTGERSTVLPDHCSRGLGHAWSPDGRLLAHDVVAGARHELVVTDIATGLSRTAGDAAGANRLAWRPDGTGLVVHGLPPARSSRLVLLAGRGELPLGNDGFGGFSRDGRQYLVPGNGAVSVGRAAGAERAIATLANGARWLEGAWSADSRWVVVVTQPKQHSHFALNLQTGDLAERTEGAGCDPGADPLSVMSPDGNRRARVAWDAERQALRIVVVDNLRTGRTGLLVDGDANFQSLVWAPDSLHVGYARRPGKNGEPASYGVGTLPAGDTREVATFTTEGTLIASAVAPGGRIVAFAFGDKTGVLLSVEGQRGMSPVVRSAAQITCLAFTAENELLFTSAVGE